MVSTTWVDVSLVDVNSQDYAQKRLYEQCSVLQCSRASQISVHVAALWLTQFRLTFNPHMYVGWLDPVQLGFGLSADARSPCSTQFAPRGGWTHVRWSYLAHVTDVNINNFGTSCNLFMIFAGLSVATSYSNCRAKLFAKEVLGC